MCLLGARLCGSGPALLLMTAVRNVGLIICCLLLVVIVRTGGSLTESNSSSCNANFTGGFLLASC